MLEKMSFPADYVVLDRNIGRRNARVLYLHMNKSAQLNLRGNEDISKRSV